MYISKPSSPEELYQFFVKGMPLKPIGRYYNYQFRRKGWNTFTYPIAHKGNRGMRLEFYSAIGSYYPDWKLPIYQYADTETN